MSAEPAPIVRLQRYDEDDPFGPVPYSAPPRLWTVWAMIPVAALVSSTVASATLGILFYPAARQLRAMALGPASLARALLAQPAGYYGAGLGTCLSLAACALVAATLSPTVASLRERLRLHEPPRWMLPGLAGAMAMVGVSRLGNSLREVLGTFGEGPVGVLPHEFTGMSPELTVLGVVIVGVGAGVGEELFFRGYLQTRLELRWPPWLANLLVAAFFGLAHGEAWHATFAFGYGLLLGWLARRAGSILTSMTAHVLNNAFWVVMMSLGRADRDAWHHERGLASFALGALLVTAGVAGAWALTRRPRES
jgi:membrane protease YdiL (CAAX protease family)